MVTSLSSLDLRLLLVFNAVMETRSVSAAASRIGMSQPAMSLALNRLRFALKDQLFTRAAEGMRPTPRAFELAGPIGEALKQIAEALEPRDFLPQDSTTPFKIAFSDQTAIVVLPRLLKQLSRVAPHVRLRTEPKWNATVETQLDNAEIDLAVGIIPKLPKRFSTSVLFEDRYVCMMRKNHPLAGKPIDVAQFSGAEHLAVRPSLARSSQIDKALNKMGGVRNIVLNVNQFLSVPSVLQETDLIACLLRSVAQHFDQSRFYFCPIPFPYDPMRIVVAWSRARSQNAAQAWMRTQLMDASTPLRNALQDDGYSLTDKVHAKSR